jgi:hypothetical protein
MPWSILARWRQRQVRLNAAPREEFIRRFAPGRSFVDVGAMWNVNGQMAFLAEDCGATAVTAIDVMSPTEAFEAEHRRRDSKVRFLRGDIHDASVVEAAGPHDVVWCSGVVYHAPNPLLTLQRLREVTAETLILATETIPEVAGLAQACVFFPGLAEQDRALHAAARPHGVAHGIHTAFDPSQGYSAWWWGITRSALHGMLQASGFRVVEEHGGPLHATIAAVPTGQMPPADGVQ